MSKDKEFDILYNKYNIAIAQVKDLQEQLTTKQEQWAKRNEDFDIMEKNVRELCESILAKDPNEMVLGKDYSWATIPVFELVIKSKKVFKEYNDKRTDVMRKLMDELEDRRNQIDSLKEEIVTIKTMGSSAQTVSEKEIREQIEKNNEKRIEQEKVKTASKSMSVSVQKALKNDTLDIQMVKESLKDGKAVIIEDDMDDEPISEGTKIEDKVRKEGIKDGKKSKLTPTSIPSSPSQKIIKARREAKIKEDRDYTVNLLSEMESKLTDIGWTAVRIAGETGISNMNELIEELRREMEENGSIVSQATARRTIVDASNIGMFTKENVVTPFGMFHVVSLTADGARCYKRRFKKDIVTSEHDRLIAEHDNITHGYSIKLVADLIKETECCKEVEIWNRKKNAIKVSGNNITYIPDITCTLENGEHMYIEYELGHYTQSEFNTKNNKMFTATNHINYIVPNKNDAIKMMEKLVAWSKTLPTNGKVRHLVIRVTTAGAVRGQDLTKNANWMFTYKPSSDKEPQNHF